ncbi:hypothetical protein Tco_0829808 [Tanacetum coccineum]
MVVTTRNTLSGSSNGSPLVLDYETKRFLAKTIAGMVKGSLATMQRLAKIEFPNFSGDDVKGWVFRCDQFFVMKQTPEMDNVPLISIHLYDKALLWHSQFVRIHGNNCETTAKEYEDAFDNLLGRVEVNEDHAVSLFMGSLPTEIKMGNSSSTFKPLVTNPETASGIVNTKPNALVTEHKCSGPLYSLVLLPEIENEGGEFLEEDESLVDIGLMDLEAPLISLNALTVADGNKLVTNAKCKEFKWQFAPNVFTTDVMLSPLGGCEMVLEIQWLETLGDIRFNFHEFRMGFKYKGQKLYSVAMCVFPNSAATCMQIEEVPATSIHPILQQVIAAYEDVFAVPATTKK